MIFLFLISLRNFHTILHSSCTILHSYQAHTGSTFSTSSLVLTFFLPFFFFFDNCHSDRSEVVFMVFLICISLMTTVFEHFLSLLAICISFLEKISIQVFGPFFFLFFFLIEVLLVYNIVLVSGIQQSDLVICIYLYF